MNIQVEWICKASYVERGVKLACPLLACLSPITYMFNNPEAPHTPYYWDFYGDFIM